MSCLKKLTLFCGLIGQVMAKEDPLDELVTLAGPDGSLFTLPNAHGITIYGTESKTPDTKVHFSGFGDVEARSYGSRSSSKFALAIHHVSGDGSEWEPIAERLQQQGWFVLVPNWRSLPGTDPQQYFGPHGNWSEFPESYESNLNDILKQFGYSKFDALIGFSWGGWVAGQRAGNFPNSVGQLALVAPAFGSRDECDGIHIDTPSILIWGETDEWVRYTPNRVDFVLNMFSHVEFVHEPGGHYIAPAWEDLIVSFVTTGEIKRKRHFLEKRKGALALKA